MARSSGVGTLGTHRQRDGARGRKVKINGQAVPVLYSSAAQVDFLCPALDPGTQLSLVVETPAGLAGALTATMQKPLP